MRRMVLPLTSVGFAVMLSLAVALLSGAYTDSVPTADAQTASKPNFVFILADDMRKDDLRYMRKARSLLGNQGKTFANAYVSYGLCCPSRATILRGQYAHNSGVWNNSAPRGVGRVQGQRQRAGQRGHAPRRRRLQDRLLGQVLQRLRWERRAPGLGQMVRNL
jgi:arylsulfatase A-like enzyme